MIEDTHFKAIRDAHLRGEDRLAWRATEEWVSLKPLVEIFCYGLLNKA